MRIDFSKKLTLDFTQRVFLCQTQSYLLVRKGNKYGHFLTMAGGSIEMVKLPFEEDGYIFTKRNEGEASKEVPIIRMPLKPYAYPLTKALEVYKNSTLSKSVKAARAIDELLGIEPQREDPAEPVAGPSDGQGYTLQDLCQELGLTSGEARAKLRQRGVQKPGSRWEWPSAKAAAAARKALAG